MPRCYSYCRWSSGKQTSGTSLVRQMEMAQDWVEARKDRGFYLDQQVIIDAGKSGHYGDNLDPEQGNLARFIEKAKSGEIEQNSYLIIEKLDRFSRADPVQIEHLIHEIVKKYRINIVLLHPVEREITKDTIGKTDLRLLMFIELEIANAQSKEKSHRLRKAWEQKRKRIRERQHQIQNLPNWLYLDKASKDIKVDKEKLAAIEYLFKRTIEGVGQVVLCKEMTDKFRPISNPSKKWPNQHWNKSYISKLLRDRRLLGEYQPHKFDVIENDENLILSKRKRRQEGSPITDYYPRVITDELFNKAQTEKHKRWKAKTDSRMEMLNLFRGLVFCKYSGNTMQLNTTRSKRKNGATYVQKRLADYGHLRGDKKCCPWSIEYHRFEHLILDALSEIDGKTFKKKAKGVVAEKRGLIDERLAIEAQLQKLKSQLSDPRHFSITETILDSVTRLNDRLADMESRIQLLEVIDEDIGSNAIEGLRSVADIFGENGKGDVSRRKQIRDILPHIVRRIEVIPLKAANREVLALIAIDLADDTRRLCLMRKQNLRVANKVLLIDGNRKPVLAATKNGYIFYPKTYPGRELKKVAVLVDGKIPSDREGGRKLIAYFAQAPKDVRDLLRAKEPRKWQKIDLTTIYNAHYLGNRIQPTQQEDS
jgi:DNA invertase Pin-like site-specific DNA recombinase